MWQTWKSIYLTSNPQARFPLQTKVTGVIEDSEIPLPSSHRPFQLCSKFGSGIQGYTCLRGEQEQDAARCSDAGWPSLSLISQYQ